MPSVRGCAWRSSWAAAAPPAKVYGAGNTADATRGRARSSSARRYPCARTDSTSSWPCGVLRPPIIPGRVQPASRRCRSEEHTSELQSRFDLVCRLLLEKKQETVWHLLDILRTTSS